jgi:hypothetical protein
MKIDNKIPASFDEAVKMLVASFDFEDRIAIIKDKYNTPYHFSAGMAIRNEWSLWKKGTPLDLDFRNRFGIAHGDDKSGLLFTAAIAEILGDNVEDKVKETVQRYKDHWESAGCDPMMDK